MIWLLLGQGPFSIQTERVDSTADTVSAVTLKGHPLAGWRYWRAFSVGPNDVVIETGTVDEPGPGFKNYAGYYIFNGTVLKGWQLFLQYIQQGLGAALGPPPGSDPARNFNIMKMKELRKGRCLTMRDVYELSREIAGVRHSRAFLIPPSRLSEIEIRGVVPNIYKLYVLSFAYELSLDKLLRIYGLEFRRWKD